MIADEITTPSAGTTVGDVRSEIEVLVDGSITVVIAVIARLIRGCPLGRGITGHRFAVANVESAASALTYAIGTRSAQEGKGLVDSTIAVIIAPITALCGYRATGVAGVEHTFINDFITVVISLITDLKRERTASSACVLYPFINPSIAVVILLIADFKRDRATETTGIEYTFIDDPIAVVILSIAEFSGDSTAETTGVEDPLIDITVAILILSVALFDAGLSLIDQPVTVIIEAIAELSGRGSGDDVASIAPADTSQDACPSTFSDPRRALSIRQILVCLSVTVIVDKVTDLYGDSPAATASISDPFIGSAVTIVVSPVTHFDRGLATLAAGIRDVLVCLSVTVIIDRVTDLEGERATPAAGVSNSFIGSAIAVIICCVTSLRWDIPTVSTSVEETFIYAVVAVVICAVTDLNGGRVIIALAPLTINAVLYPRVTGPNIAPTASSRPRLTAADERFVDQAIAVIIEFITALFARVAELGTTAQIYLRFTADELTCFSTRTHACHARLAELIKVFINQTIAVIVERIATLCARFAFIHFNVSLHICNGLSRHVEDRWRLRVEDLNLTDRLVSLIGDLRCFIIGDSELAP